MIGCPHLPVRTGVSTPEALQKVQTAIINGVSSLLLHWFHKALCLLIKRLHTNQWEIDFPAPLLQLLQFTCLIDQ